MNQAPWDGPFDLRVFLGAKMSWFFSSCDHSHPELLSGSLGESMRKAREISEIAMICFSRGFSEPLECMKRFGPRSWPQGLFRPRFLLEPQRREIRSRKRSLSVCSPSFSLKLSTLYPDLPKDFSHLYDPSKSEHCDRWSSYRGVLESAGCHRLASIASEIAGTLLPSCMGHPAVSMSFAAMVLCKRSGVRPVGSGPKLRLEGGEAPIIRPIDLKSGSAPKESVSSESSIGGRPAFDHHIAVESTSGVVFLGERDGVCYLIGERYF